MVYKSGLEQVPAFLVKLSGIHARWVSRSMIDSRLNSSQLQLGHLWVGVESLTGLHDARPLSLVQAMSRHMCRTHIALSESKSQ